jgi:hypothetical protein
METKHQFTRRDLIKLAGTAAIGFPATTLTGRASAKPADNQTSTPPDSARPFPKGFL